MLRFLLALTLLLASAVYATPPTKAKSPSYCAKIEQLLCNGPASTFYPKDKMTIIASVLSDEDPDFNTAAKRIAQVPPAKRKKALVAELSKLEGKPFICKAFDVAWDGRESNCPKAKPTEVREGCLVVANSQAPVVEVKKVASAFFHGQGPHAPATMTLDSKAPTW